MKNFSKFTGTLALPIILSAVWLKTPVDVQEEVNPFKKDLCETIEERQRVSQVKEALEIVLRGLEKIEYQESQELDKED